MIAEAIQKIIDISVPHFLDTDAGTFSDKNMTRIPRSVRAEPITVRSLKGFTDYIKEIYMDDTPMTRDYFVIVENERRVSLMSFLDEDKRREVIIRADAETPDIEFDRFRETERMIIALQTKFVNDPKTDLAKVQKFVGTTTAGTVKEYSDDGVTQQATVKQGVRGKVDEIVPNPCRLRPIRTFAEVEQPDSLFAFRLRQDGGEVSGALFEADGGVWRLSAIENIKAYLKDELKETGVKVIG